MFCMIFSSLSNSLTNIYNGALWYNSYRFDAKNFIVDVCDCLGYATDYFTLQKSILESAFDKLENVYELETKCKHSFLYKRITK